MAWVFLQVLLAFGVAIFIVWWTIPKSPKNDKDPDKDPERKLEKPHEPPDTPPR